MRGVISWNDGRSDQMGVIIEKYPNYTKPQRKMDKYTVPGRNGDILMVQDAWEDVEQKYDLIIGDGEKHSAPEYFDRLASWLCAPAGYQELWDSFDPEHYRLAYISDQINMESLSIGNVGRIGVVFTCKPQKYLVSGKAEITITTTGFKIYNPTAYSSKPMVHVTGASGTVTVNGTIFSITSIPSGGIYIDCEEMDCYDDNGANVNSTVSSNTNEFAVLKPGENVTGFTGSITAITITPRWFEI